MSDNYKCAWCGRSFEKSGGARFLTGFTMGISDFGKKYCSRACEHAADEAKNGSKPSTSNQKDESTRKTEFTKESNQSGEPVIVNKGDGFLTTSVKTFGSLYGQLLDDSADRADKAKLDGKIDDVTSIVFGSDKDEISNILNQLSSLASTKPDKNLKNAIIEKMEFGIMKLKGLKAHTEADYFEKKLEPLKKKSWF